MKPNKIIILLSLLVLTSCTAKNISTPPPQILETISATPTPLPQKYLIKAPFVPQAPEKNWDQPWQDLCEEAALLTLVYHRQNLSPDTTQIKNDLLKIVDYQTKKGWGHDVNLLQIKETLLDLYQLDSQIIDNPTTDQIEQFIANNTPVLATANGKKLFKENKHFKNGGPLYHAFVILGFDSKKKIFTVHDVGTQFGAYFKYTYNTLTDSIHDLPATGKTDINTGPKSILVLL